MTVQLQKTLTAIAHSWLCDVMGHLNTRHYVGMFDDANFIVLNNLRPASTEGVRSDGFGWADVRNEIDYLAEVPAGAIVDIYTGINRVGTKSITAYAQMQAAHDPQKIHAKMTATIVFFDLNRRCAAPLTDEILGRARSMLIA